MGKWKLVQYREKKQRGKRDAETQNTAPDWRLYDLDNDIGEENDISGQQESVVQKILSLLKRDGL